MPDGAMFFGPDDVPPEDREVIDNFLRERAEDAEGFMSMDVDNLPPEVAAAFKNMFFRRQMQERASKPTMVDTIQPSKEQLNLKPGDKCYMASGIEEIEARGLTLLEVLDPADYAGLFPDWEERIELNGVILGKYWTTEDNEEPELGWFPRISLIYLPESWMWDEYWLYMKDGTLPDNPPEWLLQRTIDNIQGISENNGNKVPKPATCIECGSTAVLFVAGERQTHKYFVGYPTDEQDDHINYVTYGKHGMSGERSAIVECSSCGYHDDLFKRSTQIVLNDKHDFEVS